MTRGGRHFRFAPGESNGERGCKFTLKPASTGASWRLPKGKRGRDEGEEAGGAKRVKLEEGGPSGTMLTTRGSGETEDGADGGGGEEEKEEEKEKEKEEEKEEEEEGGEVQEPAWRVLAFDEGLWLDLIELLSQHGSGRGTTLSRLGTHVPPQARQYIQVRRGQYSMSGWAVHPGGWAVRPWGAAHSQVGGRYTPR